MSTQDRQQYQYDTPPLRTAASAHDGPVTVLDHLFIASLKIYSLSPGLSITAM
jgi:hypothetical protein